LECKTDGIEKGKRNALDCNGNRKKFLKRKNNDGMHSW